jgi:hypothetical protein
MLTSNLCQSYCITHLTNEDYPHQHTVYVNILGKGLHSQNFIFFVTYKSAQ